MGSSQSRRITALFPLLCVFLWTKWKAQCLLRRDEASTRLPGSSFLGPKWKWGSVSDSSHKKLAAHFTAGLNRNSDHQLRHTKGECECRQWPHRTTQKRTDRAVTRLCVDRLYIIRSWVCLYGAARSSLNKRPLERILDQIVIKHQRRV